MSGRLTLRGAPVVVAPGKLFLAGEYAVLHGKPAVVMAVSRHAVAQYIPGFDPESDVIAKAVEFAVKSLGEAAEALPPGSVMIQSADFKSGDRKLGIGSSAAAAAATVGAVFEYCGYPIADHEDEVFEVAERAHREAQGGIGSGADVAASVHGGFLHYVRPAEGPPTRRALSPVPNLQIVPFLCGEAVATTDMIQAFQKLETERAALHRWMLDELGTSSGAFAEAFSKQDAPGVIAATRACLEAMRELGTALERPVVTPEFDAVAKVAAGLHGAAKPSGAGGGDVGVALFTTPLDAEKFRASCPAGVIPLDIDPSEDGVVRRRAPLVAVSE